MAVKKTNRPKPMSERQKAMQTMKPAGKNQPLPKKLTGADALKAFQKEISPKGMAKTKAKQTAALDKLMVKRYGKKK